MDLESKIDFYSKGTANSSTDYLFVLDNNFNFLFCNKASVDLTGIQSEDLSGKNYFQIFPFSLGSNIKEKFLASVQSQKSLSFTEEYGFDGIHQSLFFTLNPFSDGLTVIIKKNSDKVNFEQDPSYRNTLDNMIEGCAILDFNWKYVYLNDSHALQTMTSKESAKGKLLWKVIPGVEKSSFYSAFKTSMEKRIPQQIEDCFKFVDGSIRWYEVRSVPVPDGIFLLSIETTERKKYEEELLRLQSVFKQAERMAHLGSWWINLHETEDINSNPLKWSEEVFRIFGFEPGSVDVTNDLFFNCVHPDDRQKIKSAVAESIEHRKPYAIEHRIVRPDGTERVVVEHAELTLDRDGNPECMVGAVLDITEFKKAMNDRNKLLHEVEYESDVLKSIIRSVPDEIWVFDTHGELMFVNPTVSKGLGFEDLENLTLKKVLSTLEIRHLDGSIRKPEESALYKSLKGETVKGEEMIRHLKTGEYRFRQFHSAPMKDTYGKIFGVVVIVSDITERKKSEEKIRELLSLSERRTAELNTTIESIPDAIIISNREGITKINNNALKILGADSLEDLQDRIGELGKKFNVRHPDGTPLREDELQLLRALNGETLEEEVLATNVRTGEDIFIRIAAAPIREKGNIIGAVAVESDITEKKKAEETLKGSLKEKEVLLRELYHRTKNNMQVISSLLNLKAADLNDPVITEVLEDMKNRILAISLVHQKLYQSKNLSRVNISEYITDLINLLKTSHLIHSQRIEFKLDIEDINVLLDTAVPCGLIINELVSNSLKYAFPGNKKGIIEIKFLTKENDDLELTVSDNGVGINDNFTEDNYNLGLRLFHIIAEDQLQAETNLDTSNGVSWSVTFKDVLYDERV